MKKVVATCGVIVLYAAGLPFGEPGISGALIFLGSCLCLSALALVVYPLLERIIGELELAYYVEKQKEALEQRKLAHDQQIEHAQQLLHQPAGH